MQSAQFREILSRVCRGEEAALSLDADGQTVLRRFLPKPRLILLGGGHVAKALCAFASMLDFSVAVCDDRPAFANRERFPGAETVICDAFPAAIASLRIRGTDCVCVMTRGHRWDKECLDAVFSGPRPDYLGMVGSHRRSDGLRRTLLEEGRDPERVAALHAPVGLPIGAVTPEEIAVSICAQLIAHRSTGRKPDENGVLGESRADIPLLEFLAGPGEPRALLTVLSATGSTPAKPGAMMALDRLGAAVGTVGGGCAEAAAMARARRLIGTGRQEVFTVDLTAEDAEKEGMVCGGTLRLLIADVEDGID